MTTSEQISPEFKPESPAHTTGLCNCCGSTLASRPALTGVDRLLGIPGEFDIFVCDSCGAGTTRPFVKDEDLASLYVGEYPNHSTSVEITSPRGLRQRLQREQLVSITHGFPLKALQPPRGRLLDVGCGNAAITGLLMADGWSVVGIEPDPTICEIARGRIDDVRVGDIKTADLDGELFDAVLFNHTLEHVAHPQIDLRRAWELLKPGGTLVIAVPHFDCWERKVFKNKWLMLELPRHRTHFTRKGLRSLVENTGFRLQEVKCTTSMGILAASVAISITGHSRFHESLWGSWLLPAISLVLRPPTALANRVLNDGEVLGLVATRPID